MTTQQKIKAYTNAHNELLKKYKLALKVVINFPQGKRVPLLSRMAIKVLQKQGGVLDVAILSK